MNKKIDFYLSSTDYKNFEIPRACFVIGRLQGENRDDFMLVDSFLFDKKGGINTKTSIRFVFSPRFEGAHAFPINEWPLDVYICELLNEGCLKNMKCIKDDLKIVAWGQLYQELKNIRW